MKTIVSYRVRPEELSFSHEDFETLDLAIERATKRNAPRIQQGETEKLYKGDNCKIQKVTTTIEDITF